MKKRAKKDKAKPAAVAKKTKRQLGAYGDRIKISDDFNDPLPDEIMDAFEGKIERKQDHK
jgi:hypothetical protein